MRVVVVGATGNLGTSVLRSLEGEEKADPILGLARRSPDLTVSKVEWAVADVTTDALAPHFEGADAVILLSWLIQPSRDLNRLWMVNVEGSSRVMRAVKEAGIPALRPVSLGFVLRATGQGFMTPTWVKEVQSFEADEELDVPGRLRAIRTPGHTQGHASPVSAEKDVLFAGDALVTLDPLTRERGPRLTSDSLLNTDPAQSRASLDALLCRGQHAAPRTR